LHVHASYADLASGAVTPGRQNTAHSTAATVDVVGGPGSGAVRNVKTLTIRNTSATTTTSVTIIHTDGSTAMELFFAVLGPGAQLVYADDVGFSVQTRIDLPGDAWSGKIMACCRDGNPNYLLNQMQVAGNIAPTPTNIAVTIARCEFFRPAYSLTAATLRWYGVGATTNLYNVALYRWSDLSRLTDAYALTTSATTWGAVTLAATLELTAGELYFLAISALSTGTTAGISANGGTVAATTGQIATAPGALPGSLAPVNLSSFRFQFATTSGTLPATANAPVAQANWTGGMPAFFLDAV
jgi:hypothetical protein